MAKFYYLEPEVAGELGEDTVMDTSVHPPIVSAVHYDFMDWLGDDLIEAFPCFLITEQGGQRLATQALSGYELAPAKVTRSEMFEELESGRTLPRFWWLKVGGKAGQEDFGLAADHRLVVSERALDCLRTLRLEGCDVTEFSASS